MRVRTRGTRIIQKFTLCSEKLLCRNTQDSPYSVLSVAAAVPTRIFSETWVGRKAWIASNASSVSRAGIGSGDGIGSSAVIGSGARIASDAAIGSRDEIGPGAGMASGARIASVVEIVSGAETASSAKYGTSLYNPLSRNVTTFTYDTITTINTLIFSIFLGFSYYTT
jgi:UDP-3-O-[3-hydroxymyristoyl] glucosamine N-acyltransferase